MYVKGCTAKECLRRMCWSQRRNLEKATAQSPVIFVSRPISCKDTNMANVEFGTGKTVLILTIVAACFAVLWPKIFYPMLVSSGAEPHSDSDNGCCDVIFETDVNAIKIMSEMCGSIFIKHEDLDLKLTRTFQEGKYSKKLIDICRSEVMNICGTDIAEILNKKVRLGHSYKQILDEIRSYNISVCLRQNFGINPGTLGTPRRMRLRGPATSRHLRQERPLHLRPEMMHPALRERGRAIPQGSLPVKKAPEEGISRQPPVPGMRPPMGGAGHVVPPPKVGTTMSIVMPLYTIGIVIFSIYTIMKVFVRKTGNNDNYKDFSSDPEFRRMVFAEEYSNGCAGFGKEEGLSSRSKREPPPPLFKAPSDDATRLVMTAITGLLAEVDQQLNREGDTQTQYSTDLKEEKRIIEEICTEDTASSGKKDLITAEQVDKRAKSKLQLSLSDEKVDDGPVEDGSKPKVKVIGVEMVAECEGGQRWSRPATPTLGVGSTSIRGSTWLTEDMEPNDIFLEGALPTQSQLLVTDSKTQTLTVPQDDGSETPVILSGKVTLSLISLDARSPADGTSHTDSAMMEDRNRSAQKEEMIAEEYEKSEKAEDDGTTHYTTATMSEEAEALEVEDNRADISNMESLDTAEDEDELEDDGQKWNGSGGDILIVPSSNGEQKEE